MIKQSIALRYSKVLFNLDLEYRLDMKKRLIDFESLDALFKRNPKLLILLKFPLIDIDEKKELLASALKNEYDPLFFEFLFYLIQKKKLDYLNLIAIDYRFLVEEHFDIWEVKVISATDLMPEMQTKLKEKLELFFHKQLKINNEVDPSIIGGIKLIFADQMIDWSVVGRLKNLKESLLVK